MGENSCRSDCLSLRNKCCTLSFTQILPSALLCLPLLLPSSPLLSPPLLHFSSHLSSSLHVIFCQFILSVLTLSRLFFTHPLSLSPIFLFSLLSSHLTTTFLPSHLLFHISSSPLCSPRSLLSFSWTSSHLLSGYFLCPWLSSLTAFLSVPCLTPCLSWSRCFHPPVSLTLPLSSPPLSSLTFFPHIILF